MLTQHAVGDGFHPHGEVPREAEAKQNEGDVRMYRRDDVFPVTSTWCKQHPWCEKHTNLDQLSNIEEGGRLSETSIFLAQMPPNSNVNSAIPASASAKRISLQFMTKLKATCSIMRPFWFKDDTFMMSCAAHLTIGLG